MGGVANLVRGTVAPGFEPVAEAFALTLRERGETGAAFAAYADGRLVADLWAGVADPVSGRPWEADTLQPIFSGTKGLVATCLLLLIERGRLALDAPVATYWPEFAAHRKEQLLVEHVVSHTAGLPGFRRRDIDPDEQRDAVHMAALLADEEPIWEPGTVLCYHPLTYGWLAAELIRRTDPARRPVGRFFAEELAAPLGLEAWIGLPAEHEPRVARLHPAPTWAGDPLSELRLQSDAAYHALWGNPRFLRDEAGFAWWNAPATHGAGLPGAGAIAHVRSIARLYACLARGGELDGVRLLRPTTIEAGRRRLSDGWSDVTQTFEAFGTGFALQTEELPYGPPLDAFGHDGAGGSVHGAWPSSRVGFSYAMNRMRDDDDATRAHSLLRALGDAVADTGR